MSDRPNFLLIVSDDQMFHTMPYMTKTVARLSPGLEFTKAYVSSPSCSPSRTTIHTGKYVHTHTISGNVGAAKQFRRRGLQFQGIGYLLSQAGYECGYLGKVLNSYEDTAAWQMPGYSEWTGVLTNRNPVRANINGKVKKTSTARRNETAWLKTRALGFIQNVEDLGKPWLCFAAVKAPHSPYDPSDAHRGELNGISLPGRDNFDHFDPNKPRDIRDEPAINQERQAYFRNVYQGKREEELDLDDAVDALCAAVDFENTYVIYCSDNGFLLGEHRLYAKGKPYEEACRTPLFIRGPGMRESATSDLLVSNADIAPTIMELAGLDPAEQGMDGRSLVPVLFESAESPVTGEAWREALLIEFLERDGKSGPKWTALRTDTHLYAEHETGERELYDMVNDPYQLTSIAGEMDEQELLEMDQRLDAMRQASGEAMREVEAA